MKKIMIALAFAAAVVSARAASVNWNVTGVASDVGQTVYLLTALAGSYENADALIADALDSGTIAKAGRKYMTGLRSTAADAVTKDSMANAYLVLISTDRQSYTYVKADMSAETYDMNNQETAPAAPFETSVAAITAGGTTVAFGNVPEPTGAMLLALGVAALALRRRRR